MTNLKKLTILLFIVFIFIVGALIFEKYMILLMLVLISIFLIYKWYYLLSEEMIIYQLFKKNNKENIEGLVKFFGKKTFKAIESLKKKGIVEMNGNDVVLRRNDYKFTLFPFVNTKEDNE